MSFPCIVNLSICSGHCHFLGLSYVELQLSFTLFLFQVDVQRLERDIYQNDDIQTIFDLVDGALYLRISVQIYNTMDDFVRLASVLKRYLNNNVVGN